MDRARAAAAQPVASLARGGNAGLRNRRRSRTQYGIQVAAPNARRAKRRYPRFSARAGVGEERAKRSPRTAAASALAAKERT